jgi:hypothetical protein
MSAKDFIFYIGCDCLIFDNLENPKLGSPAYIEGVDIVANKVICERANFDPSVIKPILRPISSMKIEEAIEVIKWTLHPAYDYPQTDYRFEVLNSSVSIEIQNDLWQEKIYIGQTLGSIWSKSGKVKIPHFVYNFLFEKRFDTLFWIDEGRAISAVETKQVGILNLSEMKFMVKTV